MVNYFFFVRSSIVEYEQEPRAEIKAMDSFFYSISKIQIFQYILGLYKEIIQ